MLLFFLTGVLIALGHHVYYNTRAGMIVPSSNGPNWQIQGQELVLRFGLEIAFLTNAFLVNAVGRAYTQCAWSVAKRRTVTIDGLDALFSAFEDPWAFRRLEV